MQPQALSFGLRHHAALTVSDIERAKRFYTDVPGLQLVATFGLQGSCKVRGEREHERSE